MSEKPISVRSILKPSDFPLIAEQIVTLFKERQKRRSHLEDHWKEIDRQLRMEPDKAQKRTAGGQLDENSKWLPEIELPDQAQTLEILTDDVMRFIFPRGKDWFRAVAALTEKYITRFTQAETPIVGEKGQRDFDLDGEAANRIAQAIPSHFHRQYKFREHVQKCQAEALKYGFGVGRVRRINTEIFGHTLKGDTRKHKIPALIPRTSKRVYLDDRVENVMHEGEIIGPNIIQVMTRKLSDMRIAAKNDDSYIESQLMRIVPDKNDTITLIEMEGDLVYSTSRETFVIKDVILTAAFSEESEASNFGLIREQKGEGFSTYIVFDYHKESADDAYATAPLIKGRPLQKANSLIMSQLIASGQLKIQPPLAYDPDDPHFKSSGGPVVEPGALWETTEGVDPADVGGDPNTFFGIFAGLTERYNDVTGNQPARAGAETKSHTTAFAKDAELQRGQTRTVDYTDDTLLDPMTRLLELEYRMGVPNWRKQVVYIEPWREFLELSKAHLPDIVYFEALGAAAPAEDVARQQQHINAITQAMQIDASALQLGFRQSPRLDYDAIQDKILEDAGIQDVSQFVVETEESGQVPTGQLPGVLSAEPEQLQ